MRGAGRVSADQSGAGWLRYAGMMGMARYVGLTRDPHPPPTPLYAQGHPSTLYALIHTFHHYPYPNTNVRISPCPTPRGVSHMKIVDTNIRSHYH